MNTDANEKNLALAAMRGATGIPHDAAKNAAAYEKQLYGSYPSNNRHERRKAAKLARTKK